MNADSQAAALFTIKVELNGPKILDADLSKVTEFMASGKHPGKDIKSGHFGLPDMMIPWHSVQFRSNRSSEAALKNHGALFPLRSTRSALYEAAHRQKFFRKREGRI